MVESLNRDCLWWRDGGRALGKGREVLISDTEIVGTGHIVSYRRDTLAFSFLQEVLMDHPLDLGKKWRSQSPAFCSLCAIGKMENKHVNNDAFLNCKKAMKGNEQYDEAGVGGDLQSICSSRRRSAGWSWDREARAEPATPRFGGWRGHYWFWFCLFFFPTGFKTPLRKKKNNVIIIANHHWLQNTFWFQRDYNVLKFMFSHQCNTPKLKLRSEERLGWLEWLKKNLIGL